MLNPLTNAFQDYPEVGLMKNACFESNHSPLLTIRSKITTALLLGTNNQFFIVASPKFVAKIRLQSDKYTG